MGIRIKFDEIIDYVIQNNGLTGSLYILGTEDCSFSYKQYLKRHPELKESFPSPSSTLMDTKEYFNLKGFAGAHTIDLNERADLRIDLNVPLSEKYYGIADWIVDFGTLEHVFNIFEAISNIHRMLKPSGIILHTTPVSFWYHGYYNINPKFFEDFYSANGYKSILETFQVTIMNPFYSRFTSFLPPYFFRCNMPFKSKTKQYRTAKYFKLIASRFGMPGYTLYITACKKGNIETTVRLPYDIWK